MPQPCGGLLTPNSGGRSTRGCRFQRGPSILCCSFDGRDRSSELRVRRLRDASPSLTHARWSIPDLHRLTTNGGGRCLRGRGAGSSRGRLPNAGKVSRRLCPSSLAGTCVAQQSCGYQLWRARRSSRQKLVLVARARRRPSRRPRAGGGLIGDRLYESGGPAGRGIAGRTAARHRPSLVERRLYPQCVTLTTEIRGWWRTV